MRSAETDGTGRMPLPVFHPCQRVQPEMLSAAMATPSPIFFNPSRLRRNPVLGVALVDEREEFGVTRETSEFIDSGIIKVDRT